MSQEPFSYLSSVLPTKVLRDHASLVYGLYVSLAFGFIEAAEMITVVWEHTGIELRHSEIYASIRDNGALLKDVKQYAFVQAAAAIPKYQKLLNPSMFYSELSRAERTRVHHALDYGLLAKGLKAQLRQGRIPQSIQDIDDAVVETLNHDPQLEVYIGKFVNHKMSFIMKSGGKSFNELLSDMMMAAYYGLLRTYPAWSDPGHRVAIAKINARNRGHNIIKETAAAMRKPLQGSKDAGYESVLVSMDSMEIGAGDAVILELGGACAKFDGSTSADDSIDWDTKKSLQELLVSPELEPLQRRYLRMLMGEHCEDFSLWLGEPSNTEVANRLPFERYDERVREYLNIPSLAAKKFLNELREFYL